MIRVICIVLLILPVSLSAETLSASSGMALIGEGQARYLSFIKVYDARLFAPEGSSAADIVRAQTSYCLELDYRVALKKDDFIEAAETVLKRQHSTAYLTEMDDRVTLLHNNYKAVKKGDRYLLCYDSNSETSSLTLNDQVLVRVPGRDFAELYGGIWLGPEKPLDRDLRDDLLRGGRKGQD